MLPHRRDACSRRPGRRRPSAWPLTFSVTLLLPARVAATPSAAPTHSPSLGPKTAGPTAGPTRSSPTVSPTTGPPTASPSIAPYKPATPSASPATTGPSVGPTTFAPTVSPTPNPTVPPTRSPTRSPSVPPTPNPTVSPTLRPTNPPSVSPTRLPSAPPSTSPTKNPTTSPTSSPTASPSRSPSTSPSLSPTVPPSASPTRNPSAPPTANPSASPTNPPSSSPSTPPTMSPSSSPSVPPTKSPTLGPTAAPSFSAPTGSPSERPTLSPSTQSPSAAPTSAPSDHPSTSPTLMPTSRPSLPPTDSPSRPPTVSPTRRPTVPPTTSPPTVPPSSSTPTKHPSGSPTNSPSVFPSQSPTYFPSTPPTRTPTAHPSEPPTAFPTRSPSTSPTGSPTRNPTRHPTTSPTSSPSRHPTIGPTRPPTRHPTQHPTVSPSGSPTRHPTAHPSFSPTELQCPVDHWGHQSVCLPCPTGTHRKLSDPVTVCQHTLCAADQRVRSNICTACPVGTTNAAGDDATGLDTSCDPWFCQRNQHVVANRCVPCGAGLRNAANDDASGPDTDCDVAAAVLVDPAALTLDEHGGTRTFAVRLASAPYADVTIRVRSSDEALGIATPSELRFTPTHWGRQTVTVRAVQDAAHANQAPFTVTLEPAASADQDYNALAVSGSSTVVTVRSVDDDAAGVIVSPSTGLITTEAGGQAIFTVTLVSQPTTEVRMRVESSDTAEAVVSQANLVFDTQFGAHGWSSPHTVTVTGVDDSTADGNVSYVVRLAAESADPAYNRIAVSAVRCLNVDDDAASIAFLPLTAAVTSEGAGGAGRVARFSVALTSQPTADVVLHFRSNDESEGVADPRSLTFTAASWSQTRTVTVRGVDDETADGDRPFNITIEGVSADLSYRKVWRRQQYTNTDDDTAGILVTPAARQETSEDGQTATFTVTLRSRPASLVTIALRSSDPTEGEVWPSTLVFQTNWALGVNITVRGRPDGIDDGDVEYSIKGEATSADPLYNKAPIADMLCINRNVDRAAIVVIPNTTAGPQLMIGEDGRTATFTVRLLTQPSADVTVNLISSDAGEGVVTPGRLVFSEAEWRIPLTATVTGVADGVDDGMSSFRIVTGPAVSQDPKYHGINPADVAVLSANVDSAYVTVDPWAGLVTTEQGGSATFVVSLGTMPTAAVTIALFSNDTSEGVVDRQSLSFNSGSWATPQTVTVTGVQDAVQDGDVAYSVVTSAVVSTDERYRGLDPADVQVTNRDDDRAGINVDAPLAGLLVSEPNGQATFTVVLDTQPAHQVTIEMLVSDPSEAELTPGSLVFSPAAGSWATPKTVTLTAKDDLLDDGDVSFSVDFRPAQSADSRYSGMRAPSVHAVCKNDDAAGLVVDPTQGLSTTESGGQATFTFALRSEPADGVICSVTSLDTTEAVASPNRVAFSDSNWKVPQTVTVTGIDDFVFDGTVRYKVRAGPCTSADTRYNSAEPVLVELDNVDLDTQGAYLLTTLTLDATQYAVDEGMCPQVISDLASTMSFPTTSVDKCTADAASGTTEQGIATLEIRNSQTRDTACAALRDLAARIRAAPGSLTLAGRALMDSTATPIGCPKLTCLSFPATACGAKDLVDAPGEHQCPEAACDAGTCCQPALRQVAVYGDSSCGAPEWDVQPGARNGFCQEVSRAAGIAVAREYGAVHCDAATGLVYARVGFASIADCTLQVGTVQKLMQDSRAVRFSCDCSGGSQRSCVPLLPGGANRYGSCSGTRTAPPTPLPLSPAAVLGAAATSSDDSAIEDWHIVLFVVAGVLVLLALLALYLCNRKGDAAAAAPGGPGATPAPGTGSTALQSPLLTGTHPDAKMVPPPVLSPSGVASPDNAHPQRFSPENQLQHESQRREHAEARLRAAEHARSLAEERAQTAERLHAEAVRATSPRAVPAATVFSSPYASGGAQGPMWHSARLPYSPPSLAPSPAPATWSRPSGGLDALAQAPVVT
eukprot:TRINITY_DN17736_c0_g1_i1.p1 TRINITY_DN17736_c0_g1~~TRINITY_DN17736_c0_g1_i1.p1  ORF type:complete len:1965 (+),score=315.64 TRINITY_DN17736_c0_g1_i1:88-5982(+)